MNVNLKQLLNRYPEIHFLSFYDVIFIDQYQYMSSLNYSVNIYHYQYMSSLNYSVNIYKPYVCVCLCTQDSGSLVVLSTRQYRLLLNKYGLSMSLQGTGLLNMHTHKHTYRVIVYICLQNSSMTTCRPAFVLILLYVFIIIFSNL